MISAERMKSVRMAPLILSFSTATQVDRWIHDGLVQLLTMLVFLRAVHQQVPDLLESLETQEQAAGHEQRHDRPRRDCADRERRRDQDRLVDERTLRDCPHHGQLAVRLHPGNLLRVEREIVAQDPRGLLRGSFGQDRDIVQHAGDVVEQGKKAGDGHGVTRAAGKPSCYGSLQGGATARVSQPCHNSGESAHDGNLRGRARVHAERPRSSGAGNVPRHSTNASCTVLTALALDSRCIAWNDLEFTPAPAAALGHGECGMYGRPGAEDAVSGIARGAGPLSVVVGTAGLERR